MDEQPDASSAGSSVTPSFRARRAGVGGPLSIAAHGLILLAFLISWPHQGHDPAPEDVVSVTLDPPPAESLKQPPGEKPMPAPEKTTGSRETPKPKAAKPAETTDAAPSKAAPADAVPPLPQAFESATPDRTAEKQAEPAETPPAPQDASQATAPPPAADQTGPDRIVAGAPELETSTRPAATPPLVTPPTTTLPLPTVAEGEPGRGLVRQTPDQAQQAMSRQPLPSETPERALPSTGQAASPTRVANLKPARRVYSDDMLSNPRIKQALGRLPREQRLNQLCGIETLEQVRRAMPGAVPDLQVRFPGGVDGDGGQAMLGAFRSRGQWFEVTYRCEVDDKASEIKAFSFAIGREIPQSEWAARKLPQD